MAQPVENWYMEVPVITRFYVTACVLTSLACQLHFVTFLQLYFNWHLIVHKFQVYRLVTNFLYFGTLGLDLLFHMFFLYRYSRYLEEGSFRGRTADYFYMLLFGATLMTVVAPFIDMIFLGSGLTCMLVYVWGRRNRHVRMSFLGLLTFTAPYLPWVLLGFSVLLNSSPLGDLLGIGIGHIYYYFEDVYPTLFPGRRPLKTPAIIKWLFEGAPRQASAEPPAGENEDEQRRPGGFRWGEGQRLGDEDQIAANGANGAH
eukprot:Opistho-2@38554